MDRARRLAWQLGARRAPVVLYGHKQPAMVVGIVAALRRGVPYVPIDSAAPPARIARMLAAVRPGAAVLAEEPPPALAELLAAAEIRTIAVDALAARIDAPPPERAEEPPAVPDPEAPAYILFTSGTTGDPKGVPIPHRALRHFADWLLATHRFVARGETFLNQAPFGFDLSVMDLYSALLTGGTLFTVARDDLAEPRRLFQRLDGAPLTTWVSTPSFARFCLAEPHFAQGMLPALRRFLFCGETLPVGVASDLIARFPRAEVWNLYGPTETTVAVTSVRIDADMLAADRPLPVGHPAPGMEVWTAPPDAPAERLAAGTSGEIVIAGPQVAPGYLGVAEGGAFFSLPDGRRAYRTGDVGTIDPHDGALFCAGRVDRQIKLHGYRLELEEIETHLRALAGVVDAAVVVVERDGRPDHLVAIVATGPSLTAAGRALTQLVRGGLAASLPEYALPRVVRRVAALPLTTNGKVDRQALRAMLE